MRIAIIGGGVSGLVSANTLKKNGHETTIFEKSSDFGGVWTTGYPGVRLQNTSHHYHISDIPWPFPPDLHPTSGQIKRYLDRAVEQLQLDLRTQHTVLELEEEENGWLLRYENKDGIHQEYFDFVVVSIGQYTEGKHRPVFPGQDQFKGEIITERDVNNLDVFNRKRIVVVGFGKSAVDMATFAVQRASQVYHIFRTPRWLIPFNIFGIHYTRFLFCRFGSILMPCWAHPTQAEQFIHKRMSSMVSFIWNMASRLFVFQCKLHGLRKGKSAQQRLKTILPGHAIVGDLRSAASMAPENYLQQIADGQILPYHSELTGFTSEAVQLLDGTEISCDQVMLCVGSESPTFPFLPDKYRALLESENDGVQLYRHLLHPDIPNLAFAGFNHGFMHVPSVEVGMLWLSAYLRGDLQLPDKENMKKCIVNVLQWKREHINFEPSRSCAVNTRFQQYIDIILKDLGLSPYRKMPNIFAEVFAQYGAPDYQGVIEEYNTKRETRTLPFKPLPFDT